MTNTTERRRMQNRIAQRNHRTRNNKHNSTPSSRNTLIWTKPFTIPLPPTRARDHKQQQQQQQQRQQQEQQAPPSPGPSSVSDLHSSPSTASPRRPTQPDKQQPQLPHVAGASAQRSCETYYGDQNHTVQDDMINDVLHGDGFSFDLSLDTACLNPVHLLSEPASSLSQGFCDYLGASNLPPVQSLTTVGGKTGTDQSILEGISSGQAWAEDRARIAAPDGGGGDGSDDEGDSSGEEDSDGDSEGHGDVAMIGGLEEEGEEDFSGYNALHLAAYLGQVGTVRLLLRLRPADADRAAEGGTSGRRQQHAPLHLAAAHDHADVARVLLDHGAEALRQDGRGRTPLHLAVRAGAYAVARLLVSRCGGERLLHIRDASGRTPLHDAVIKGDEEAVRLLLDHGADPTAVVT